MVRVRGTLRGRSPGPPPVACQDLAVGIPVLVPVLAVLPVLVPMVLLGHPLLPHLLAVFEEASVQVSVFPVDYPGHLLVPHRGQNDMVYLVLAFFQVAVLYPDLVVFRAVQPGQCHNLAILLLACVRFSSTCLIEILWYFVSF